MVLLFSYVLLALIVSFACSLMEAVFLSITPAYVGVAEQQVPEDGRRLRALKTAPDRPLAAILSLNTVAHTVGAAGAGAQAIVVFGDAYVGAFSAVLTLLILVLSEIIPKTIGARYWRFLAPLVARVLVVLGWVLWPLVKLSELLTRLLSSGEPQRVFHPEELAALAEIGKQEGTMGDDELRVLKNLLRFKTLRAMDIMTPRTVMFAVSEDLTVEQALEEHHDMRFSRIPVYTASVDDMKGYVLKSDILVNVSEDRPHVRLADIKRPFQVVPNIMSVPRLFQTLLDTREHIALVVDEYGGTDGVVTIEDVIETLLGLEIVDEADLVGDMQELAREQWRKRARALGIEVERVGEAKPPEE